MLRRAWKPIAAAVVLTGPPSYWYYSTRLRTEETFEASIRIPGVDGRPIKAMRTFPLLSKGDVDGSINKRVATESHYLRDGRTWNISTAQLPSNDPIEDTFSHAVIPKSSSDPRERLYVAVMDGHAGFHTSRLLANILIPAVSLALENKASTSSLDYFLGPLKSLVSFGRSRRLQNSSTVEEVSEIIQATFTSIDHEIISAPIKLLLANTDKKSLTKGIIPDLSANSLAKEAIKPALSGSCAIMAIIDPAEEDLYIACTGDARAVAGYWEESEDGTGRWRVEVLSEDQTGRNENELKRIQSEHPTSEADDVVRRGRILGGLEPSRAFGDARYKWSATMQEVFRQAFINDDTIPARGPPALLKTPPYVTATPVVTHRKLADSSTDATNNSVTSSMRFIVLATDGLWDQLSSKEVVALVGGYLSGLKGSVPKKSLGITVPTVDGNLGVEGKGKRMDNQEGHWAFIDENVSAHLIRNALGGGDEYSLRKLISIPAPHSRRYRDDITVTVVWWGEDTTTKHGTKAKL